MKFVALTRGNKPLGSVTTYLRNQQRDARTGTSKVPCGSCSACCRSPRTFANLMPDVRRALTRNSDGSAAGPLGAALDLLGEAQT